jgi:hypothetical protein
VFNRTLGNISDGFMLALTFAAVIGLLGWWAVSGS